jgi:HK97 family phage major capsid protein
VDSEGREVLGLRRNHSYADYLRDSGQMREEYSELTFAKFLRAMMCGPKTEIERRALAEGTSAAGGVMVPIELAGYVIDRLRSASSVLRAGAVTVPFTSKTLTIARLTGDPGIAYHTENAADFGSADATFDGVTLTAQVLGGIAKISKELVADAGNADQVIMNAFARALAVEVDRAALIGSGVSPEPKGIKNVSGIGAVSMGANGLALANYDPFVDAYRAILDGNSAPPSAYIMANRSLAATAKLKDSQNQPMRVPQLLQNIPFYSTSKLPITETMGSSNAASSIYAGDFSQLMIGMRSDVTIAILNEAYLPNFQLGIAAWIRFDVAPTHPESFVRIAGVL